ncbi:MerR family transcriptional regulator [Paramicrobacterium chengjingii]|uniref:MerR family transcriptional regulator n=1 Tax=Paramicrobacterium chengjingii TaxID=2769067 RepID=A0ABX6YGQ9_9MICO|nr:MerR family transcriptional regulator [Microbacterium chengjingii]
MREGLVSEGERTGYNQTEYDNHHLSRLKLVRSLIEVGGMSVSDVADLMTAIDDPTLPMSDVLHKAQTSIPHGAPSADDDARARILAATAERGWVVDPDNIGIALAAQAVSTCELLGRGDLVDSLPDYLEAAEEMATADLQRLGGAADRDHVVQTVIIDTIFGDRLVAGLRRAAQQNISMQANRVRDDATSHEA